MEDEADKMEEEHIMSHMVLIIDHVLRNLPMKSLHSCARVCRRWQDVVKRIKRSRRSCEWFLHNTEEGGSLRESLQKAMQDVSIEPHVALLFSSTTLYDNEKVPLDPLVSDVNGELRRSPRAAKRRSVDVATYLRRLLPSECRVCGISADGIVGTNNHTQKAFELENSSALSWLMLPDVPGVHVKSFQMANDVLDLDPEAPTNLEQLQRLTGLSVESKPKLVLLFYVEHFLYANTDLAAGLMSLNKDLVIAGGYVDNLLVDDSQEDARGTEPVVHGVAFCGDEVKVASVVLNEHVKTREQAEEQIVKLKKCNIPENNTVAFIFACIVRGEGHYGANNVEANMFKKHFPNIPLLGFFGNGEIGHEFLRNYDNPTQPEETDNTHEELEFGLPEIYHSYTSIIVMVSLGSWS